jgi:hypothetical protein
VQRPLFATHRGGVATRGRPCSCVVTRNSHSRLSSC